MSIYRDQRVAFLTQHGKQALVAPPLEAALGCRIVHTDAYDTDQLGTFTRDVDRTGTQLQAARRKARIGMALLGTDLGVASEGAFGADPHTGLLPWNVEVLVWLDAGRGLEVVGLAQGPANHCHAHLRSEAELAAFALRAGFPAHHLTLRPAHPDHPTVIKGLDHEERLRMAFRRCLKDAPNASVFAESDLRAHANPTRQRLIAQAAEDLARKLASHCPACDAPGYAVVQAISGLPCSACGEPSRLARAHLWSCLVCDQRQEAHRPGTADPAHCQRCNP